MSFFLAGLAGGVGDAMNELQARADERRAQAREELERSRAQGGRGGGRGGGSGGSGGSGGNAAAGDDFRTLPSGLYSTIRGFAENEGADAETVSNWIIETERQYGSGQFDTPEQAWNHVLRHADRDETTGGYTNTFTYPTGATRLGGGEVAPGGAGPEVMSDVQGFAGMLEGSEPAETSSTYRRDRSAQGEAAAGPAVSGFESPPSVPQSPGVGGGLPQPQSQAEYAALPSGTRYIAPDGVVRVKP